MEAFLDRISEHWTPHAGQREFLFSPAKIRVLACGRRWGKTDACAAAVLADLLRPEPTRSLILAPTLDQARLLFDRVLAFLEWLFPAESAPAFKVRLTPYPLLTLEESTVVARSGHIGRSLRGNEATHVLVDEAAFVPEALVTEVAMPMLATNNGRLTLISTPNGLNHFWRFFKMGETGENGVWSRRAPSSESPHVSKSYLAMQRKLISERAFDIEYEAKFVEASGSVFTAESIEACTVPEIFRGEEPISIGIDWGRYHDYTAVAVLEGTRNGAKLVELAQFNQATWPEMVDRAGQIADRYPHAPVLCDGTGLGDVVAGMAAARMPGRKVEAFCFTHLKKQNAIESLKYALERHTLQFEPDPELIRQLKHFEAQVSQSGVRTLNARVGYHDDLVIALALAQLGLRACHHRPVHVGVERMFENVGARFHRTH